MIEPFFTSGAPIWAVPPSAVPTWPQIHAGPFPGAGSLSTFPSDPSPALMGPTRRAYGATGAPSPVAGAAASGPAAVPIADVPGVSPSALLGTIALRRGQPQGPANDQDIEEFMYDALEMFWGTNDVEVRSEQGRVMLSGTVQQKRLKRDIGEIAWAIPAVADVQNTVTITARRRLRTGGRDAAEASPAAGRKQS